jgi:XTP/dITP diphosphohydrolase
MVFLRHAEDPAPVIAEGIWRGRILSARRGEGGFGYDPVFFDPELGRSAAELAPDEKNRISHRARALRELARRLGAGEPG